ncbi:MAG: GMC family oxidoreductase N-terminal domain-containing protein, partial [Acidobacteria bacterium]|nr:GMC family oxidoreductase N-terminal domain-containing protein [Acidobacteriota bacterium]
MPRAISTGLCDLRTHCMAAEVVLDAVGRATGIRYFDENDREQFQPADLVILSAGATETARLLLNSKSRLFPQGAGNNQGWVGHNLHGHFYRTVTGIWDKEVQGGPGPEACL